MIKVKVAENDTKNISSIFVKSSENAKKEVVEIHQVYDNDGVKALRTVYSAGLNAPTITNVYSDDENYIYVELVSGKDSVEIRFEEYSWAGDLILDGLWLSFDDYLSSGFAAYGCTRDVKVYARSVRDGEYSEVVSYEYYLGASEHTPTYTNIEADHMHTIYCDVCGEHLGEGYCNDHDDNGDFICDLCGGPISV